MKYIWLLSVLLLISLETQCQQERTLFQFSTPLHLSLKDTSKHIKVMQLARKGNFGVGTFPRIGDELIALNGEYYLSKANGRVYPATPAMKAPFAVVGNFKPEKTLAVTEDLDLPALKRFLDQSIDNKNHVQAIHIEGTFRSISLRSLPDQVPAIRLEDEKRVDKQALDLRLQQGSLVGFRYPEHMSRFNTPGYHFHFIDSSRKVGGYVIALQTGISRVEIDNLEAIKIKCTPSSSILKADAFSITILTFPMITTDHIRRIDPLLMFRTMADNLPQKLAIAHGLY
ncbi:hypothetical protein EOPP23_03595 [Endozoicomonas sp. OPT23]|uniref:acetolactate decarboxylase n=1 Tax=Endozoicomonas sp. OPT23 TaxID=2072845 RepID=UPI00129BA06D|nr:acetolactate decarboxylase [Endozoicomonas sp. OPT23]MRI32084.1 hypothetical protein [Endozoicomonas sp. OPT23]